MDLNDQVLSRDEMKTIIAGSGGYTCTYVVNMDTGWAGRLQRCRTVTTPTPTSDIGAEVGLSTSVVSGSVNYSYIGGSAYTTEEICTYTTHDLHNVGHDKKTVDINGAVARQC